MNNPEIIYYNNNSISEKLKEGLKTLLLEKNIRYFGQAAAGLQNQLVDPKYKEFNINQQVIKVGIEGEKTTSQIIRKWIADKPNAILIDSVHLPLKKNTEEFDEEEGKVESLADTDHVLIIGATVIIIDSKNWKAKTTYSIDEEDNQKILRSKKDFKGNKPKINQSKYLWKKYLQDFDNLYFESYICLSNTESNIIRDKNWWATGWKLVNQDTLVYFLDRYYEREWKYDNTIHFDVVAKILMGLQRPYDVIKHKFPTLQSMK